MTKNSINTVDGDVPLGDAFSPSRPDTDVQGKHVHGPGPSVAGQLSFTSAVTGLDLRIDPGVPQGLGVLNGHQVLEGHQDRPENDMMLPKITASATETTPSTTAPRQQRRSGGARPKCCAGAHSFETMDR